MSSKRKIENDDEVNKRRLRRRTDDSSSDSESFTISESPSVSRTEEISENESESSVKRSPLSEEHKESEIDSENKESEEEETEEESESLSESETELISSSKSFFKYVDRLKIKDPILYSEFQTVFEEVKKNEPDIIKIISTKLQLKDKVKLFHLFEIYKSSCPQTHDWFDTRNLINKKLQEGIRNQIEYDRYTSEEHKMMDNQILEIEKNINNNMLQIKYKILKLETSYENKAVIYQKFVELQSTSKDDSEYSKLFNWINNAIELPFDKIKTFPNRNSMSNFLKFAYQKMEEELFGMKKVKEQLLFFINAKLTNPNMKRTNLGLVSKPGMGKTSIARLLSSILDIGFQQISCGGVDRSDFFKGHDYTYVGSQPGEIVNCLKRMGTKNGILFFDEYEKVLSNKSISALMLHITDPSQNSEFRDNYFSELTIDLSHIWFIYAMNSLPKDEALRDRIYYIEIEDYSSREKITIVRDYILKKTLFNSGLNENDIVFDTETIKYLVNQLSNEKGLRTLEKVVMDIVNKLKFLEMHQDNEGNLPFDLSFKINRKVSFPFQVDLQTLKCIVQFEEPVDKLMLSLYV